MKITDAWLKTARSRAKVEAFDVQSQYAGLVIRIHPSGTASFRFRYRRNGARPWLVIGEYPAVSLRAAREARDQAERDLAAGLDPITEQARRRREVESARQERIDSGTVADLVEQFVHRKLRGERFDHELSQWVRDERADSAGRRQRKANIRPRKRPEDARALLVANLVKPLGREMARDITKRKLVTALDAIVDRGSPVTANRVHALASQMFAWAAAKDILPASPMVGIEKPGGDEEGRTRTLTDTEIVTIWRTLDTASMAPQTRLGLKLLLATGQRRGEVTFALKSHFDLDGALWTIPASLSKNGREHLVPLSQIAVEILRDLLQIDPASRWLMRSQYTKRKPDAPYSERALTRAVRENEAHFGIPHWTPHDLRRTCFTGMTSLGVDRMMAERVVNHTIPGVGSIYDRYEYLKEKRAALERWATYLRGLIDGTEQKVVPLMRCA